MIKSKTQFLVASFLVSLLATSITQAVLKDPSSDSQFMLLPDGTKIESIVVSNSPLALNKGEGKVFNAELQAKYEKIKLDSQTLSNYPVQWTLVDLDSEKILASSKEGDRRIFGASVSKIYVAGALLDKQNGIISPTQLQEMADMIVVSSNTAWTSLQNQIGGGDSDAGRAAIHAFTQKMGYLNTRGFQGYWGSIHGNELTTNELTAFLVDTYKARYPGAEVLWKLMYAFRTGTLRGDKYLPSDVFIGGKTGTYDGPTVDPYSGEDITVKVRHQTSVFSAGGRRFGLSVLSDTGTSETAAILTGGLAREYAGVDSRSDDSWKIAD
jgi:hypothetical protein